MTPEQISYFCQMFRKTVLIRIKSYNSITAKHSLLLRMLNCFLVLSCNLIGSTCLGASSLRFNSGKFVRGFTKFCLNKAQFGALAQSLSGEHPVWIAAEVAYNVSLNAHSLQCWIVWLLSSMSLFEKEHFTVGS